MIPYGRQEIADSDIQSVVEVLRSDFLTQGPAVPSFESKVAAYCGATHALAMNSATSALHVACLALGLGPGDTMWTTPITFVASANCGLYCGAKVDFVDIDPATYNLSVDALQEKLEAAAKSNALPKVLVITHLCGQSGEMERIHALATGYGVKIIEDASHAIGAQYQGRPVGDCRFSDITVFSFHPVKIITTAEGGMAVTNQDNLYQKMALYRSHGITRDPSQMTTETHGAWYYQQIALGFNYRMTDIQAALGCSQMLRLDSFVNRRNEIADTYNQLLATLPLVRPWQHPETRSSYHLYVVCLDPAQTRIDRRTVFDHMRMRGIGVNVHYIPVHTQPFYQAMGFAPQNFPRAMQYYEHTISLPMFPALSMEQQKYTVECLAEVLT
jgi:UDP-4-amino-4,6-dideoxy-N-acetyl-beta-L-altrosamine transaminase